MRGDIQELGRPETLLTEREPDGGTGIEKPPARGEGIGATGANSAALAQAAGDLLREAEEETAGLLHTSFVAAEGYGIGRRPASGLYRGHGARLRLSIAAAGGS